MGWIQDKVVAISQEPQLPSVSDSFIKKILVIEKNLIPDTEISLITLPILDNLAENFYLNEAQTGGLSSVYYAKNDTTDLSDLILTLEGSTLNGFVNTVVFKGFTNNEVNTPNLGDFTGVVAYNIKNINDLEELAPNSNTLKFYDSSLDNKTNFLLLAHIAKFLSLPNYGNMQLNEPPRQVLQGEYSDSPSSYDILFENKVTFYSKDNIYTKGILTSFFIGGYNAIIPYHSLEISKEVQNIMIQYIAQFEPASSMVEAKNLEAIIQKKILAKYTNKYLLADTIDIDVVPFENTFQTSLILGYLGAIWRGTITINAVQIN